MTFKLIAGHFDIKGSRPDGDTISFRPDDKNLLFMLKGKNLILKKMEQLVFDLKASIRWN